LTRSEQLETDVAFSFVDIDELYVTAIGLDRGADFL